MRTYLASMIALGLLALPGMALAQDEDDSGLDYDSQEGTANYDRDDTMAGADDDDMEKANMGRETDLDPVPKPPKPVITAGGDGIAQQAGIGGTIAYASAGVVELGGFGTLDYNSQALSIALAPFIGYFVADNVRLGALIDLNYTNTSDEEVGNVTIEGEGVLSAFAVIEPSYHYPFTDRIFGFAGIGLGVSALPGSRTLDLTTGESERGDPLFGFVVQPRVGANFLVGRSGIFTPAIRFAYSTVSSDDGPGGDSRGRAALVVEPSFGVQAGYTVMW